VAIETRTAIWEYDPDLPGNHLLGGSLDVIAAIRTLTINFGSLQWKFSYFCLDSSIWTMD
jgi:hypothetical protein